MRRSVQVQYSSADDSAMIGRQRRWSCAGLSRDRSVSDGVEVEMQVVEAERAESSRALAHQNLRVVNARVGFQDRQLAAILQDTSEVTDRSRTAIAAWFRRLPKSVRLAKCVTVCRTGACHRQQPSSTRASTSPSWPAAACPSLG